MGQRLRTTCVTKAYITVLRYPKVLLGQDLNKFFCASYCIQTSHTHTHTQLKYSVLQDIFRSSFLFYLFLLKYAVGCVSM